MQSALPPETGMAGRFPRVLNVVLAGYSIMEDGEIALPEFWGARRINDAGVTLIKRFEGLHLTPYLCPGGIRSIGYGHTRTVRAGMRITPEQAEQLLNEDLRMAERTVSRLVGVPLNGNQFSALVSFVFNVGAANFSNSTLLRLLNRGWYDQVPAQLMRWNRVAGEAMGGLTRRRAAEAALWNEPEREEAQQAAETASSAG